MNIWAVSRFSQIMMQWTALWIYLFIFLIVYLWNRPFEVELLNTKKKKWKWKLLSHVRLCDPTDYTVHGILQAIILEWVACPFSRGSSQLRDWTQVSLIAGGLSTSWITREAQISEIKPYAVFCVSFLSHMVIFLLFHSFHWMNLESISFCCFLSTV